MEKKLNGHFETVKDGIANARSKVPDPARAKEQDPARSKVPDPARAKEQDPARAEEAASAKEADVAEGNGHGGHDGEEGGEEGEGEPSAFVEFRREPAPPPPPAIAELAEACVQYVKRSLGVALDFTAETLPLLDHYLAEAEKALIAQSEADAKAAQVTLPLLVHTAGAYFGEVVRRRYPSWWRTDGDDPMTYRIELENAYLAFSPMLFVYEALARGLALHGDQDAFDAAQIEMDEEDQRAAAERLAELAVTDEEYYAPSTRLETIDVVVDTIRTRRLAAGDAVEMALTPEDYET